MRVVIRAVIKVGVFSDEVSVLELFSALGVSVCRGHLFYVMCVCVCVCFWNFDPALILLLMPSVAKFVKLL